jgi:prepilin-type N-terminal cleavage/methylation domain-containing protein
VHTTNKHNRGFTVIELVISIGVVVLVLAAAVTLTLASLTDAGRGDAKARADSLATYAANRIVQELREAKRAWLTPYEWEWGEYETLWIVFPEETEEGWYNTEQDGAQVAYFLWDDRLYRWSEGDGYHQLAEYIESVRFVGEGAVIELTVTSNVEGQTSTQSAKVCLRNS